MKVVKIGCTSISFFGLLQIVLIVLKIIGYNISWWAVFIPAFIYIGLVLLAIFVLIAIWHIGK